MLKDLTPHEYLILKKVRGVNTQPSREAIGQDEFAWLENLMPIGDAFIQAVPAPATATATIAANQSMHFATLGTVNYQICFSAAGGAQAVNLGTGAVATICSPGTFSGTPAMDQWKSERIVIADTSGMHSWDGTLFYSPGSIATVSVSVAGSGYTAAPVIGFTGGGGTGASATASILSGGVTGIFLVASGSGYTAAPGVSFTGGTSGTAATASAFIMPTGMEGRAISVYSGRSWVSNGRVVSFTAPNTWYDTNTTNAAGSSVITEGSLRQQIYASEALDNYLYLFGDSSVVVIGDVKVSGAVTTFSQTFLSSTTGSTLPNTITAMERAIIFVNKYGVYALFGASVQKISKALDGIFPRIDFSQKISAGLAQIYNILCYVVSFTYQDTNGNRSLQAAFFDGKWFFTSQGDSISFVSPASINGVLSLWGTSGTDVRQLYGDSGADIDQLMQTGLYDMGNPIVTKQVITAGIEYTAPAAASLTLTIDTENQSVSTNSTSGSSLIWYNDLTIGADLYTEGGDSVLDEDAAPLITEANSNEITWVNNAGATITWVSTAFLLDYFPAAIGGKYLGATMTSSSPQLVVNGILMEFARRASWGRP